MNNIFLTGQGGGGNKTYLQTLVNNNHYYTLDYKLTPNKKVTWSFVESDTFKDCFGSWNLVEIEKGRTEATYTVDVSFHLFVPRKITDMLVGSNLPNLMKSFKERAEGLA